MNGAFSEYVQGNVFALTLTPRMINTLAALHEERRSFLADTTCWHYGYGTTESLQRRGLIVRSSLFDFAWSADQRDRWRRTTRVEKFITVTRAGYLTLGLLVEAGMVDPKRVTPQTAPRRKVTPQ